MSIDSFYTSCFNDFLKHRYEDLKFAFPQMKTIGYEKSMLKIDPNHKWGLAAMHFEKELNLYALDELRKIKIRKG